MLENLAGKDYIISGLLSCVQQVGSEVSKWKGGERVMALLAGGGYAEEVMHGHSAGISSPIMWQSVRHTLGRFVDRKPAHCWSAATWCATILAD